MERNAERGFFVGPDDCDYDTEWELRSIAVLGMCGCGNPESAYNFVRSILAVFDRRDQKKAWVDAEEEIAKMVAADPALTAHVLSHWLADKDVTEHGGNVGGSWLTSKGEDIVDGEPAPVDDD